MLQQGKAWGPGASRKFVLLNPGPVNVSDEVRTAMAGPDWCHREGEAFDLIDEVRARLLSCLGLDRSFSAVLLGGSGTAAVEAMITSFVPEGKKLVVVRNGVYGDRIAQMAAVHGISTLEISCAWFERPDLGAVERSLSDPDVGAIALVHHETTTGLLNDVAAVGALAHSRDVLFLVDTVSGMGGEELDLVRWHVDAAACAANKCLQGMPGASFVVARRALLEEGAAAPVRTVYLNLPLYHRKQETRDTLFTPPLQVIMALRQALTELCAETIAGRIARYRALALRFRSGFESMGLHLLVPALLRSNTITALQTPAGVTYDQIHDALKEAGFIIYAGQNSLRHRMFRVANMGNIAPDDVERCLRVFRYTLGHCDE